MVFFSSLKVNESRGKQCGVTRHFSKGKDLLKKILGKDEYWRNQLRKAFSTGQNLIKKLLRKDKD